MNLTKTLMKLFLLFVFSALPLSAQKKVWEVEVTLPQARPTEKLVLEKLVVDATGNGMMQLGLSNGSIQSVPLYNVVLWVSGKGEVLTKELFFNPFAKDELRFFFTGAKQAMIYSSSGTPNPPPTDVAIGAPIIMTLTNGKKGMEKKVVYVEEPDAILLNEGPQARMASYVTTSLNIETQTAKITLWRAW